MSNNKHTDILVIGSGPGGYAAAFRAADLGREVTLVDKDPTLGGVCLNRGCIPSKTLLHIAKVLEEAESLKKMGVTFTKPTIDIDLVRDWKNKVVSQLSSGIGQMAKARKVNTIQAEATFLSDNEVQLKSESSIETITFDHCVVASGSSSSIIPGIPFDNENVLTSKTALDLKKIPESLLVIGGGYIGLEMGTVFSALGSSVSVAEFLPNLLPGADPDLVKPLARKLKKEFSEIHLSTKITKVEQAKSGVMDVTMEKNGEEITKQYEQVLVSVGRKPNTEKMGVDKTNIKVNEQGFISVDKYQKTSVKNIFAIGDIVGNPMLAHKATHEGKVAAEVICGLPAAFDAKAIPAVIFTDPEIAWVGVTETEAKESGILYEKGEFPWAASGKSLALGRNEGRTKILFDKDTKRTIGVGIVGPNAGDLISEGALAIEMGADAEDISLTVHPHPTLGETFANAAEVFEGTVTDLYIPKKTR
ncbi:dihydrolipoyl dehydrogenase [bacterium]|nr:MAG: dihydrolipoyl dehydrogenase [bacterium]